VLAGLTRTTPPEVPGGLIAVALNASLTGEELAAAVDPLAIEDPRASDVLVPDETQVRAAHPLLAAAASRQSTGGSGARRIWPSARR
jgi:hypothetical protein